MNATAAADNLGLSLLLGFFEPRSDDLNARATAVASQPHHFDAFADKVLGASSVDDLSERLESVACDPSFWAIPLPDQATIKRARSRRHWLLDRISPPLRRTLGEEPMKIFCGGWEHVASFARAMVPVIQRASSGAMAHPTHTPVDMFYDTDVPIEMRRAMLALSKAIVAAIGVFRAVRLGNRLEPWLALALARRLADGVDEFLSKLLVVMQGPTKLAPDPDEIGAWHREAIASGKDVYFPLGGPDSGAG